MTCPKINYSPANSETNASPVSEGGICTGSESNEIPSQNEGDSKFSGPLPQAKEGSPRFQAGLFVAPSVAVKDKDSVLGAYEEFVDHWLNDEMPWYEKALETPLVVFGGVGNGVLALGGVLVGCDNSGRKFENQPPAPVPANSTLNDSSPSIHFRVTPVPLDLSEFEAMSIAKKKALTGLLFSKRVEILQNKFVREALGESSSYLRLQLEGHLSKGDRRFDIFFILGKDEIGNQELSSPIAVLKKKYELDDFITQDLIDHLLILKKQFPDMDLRVGFKDSSMGYKTEDGRHVLDISGGK